MFILIMQNVTYPIPPQPRALIPTTLTSNALEKVVGGSTTTKFVYDGANVVAEYNSENTLQASYITPGLDQNLTIKRSGSTSLSIPRMNQPK